MARALVLAICALMLTSALSFGQQPPSPPGGKVEGRAAIDKLIGNTMTGTIESAPYFAFYDPSGTVKMQVGSDVGTGKWTIDGDRLCEEFPEDEDETCYHLELDGNNGTMTDEDGSVYKIEILPGNPKKL
jgi:hypothetical protein